jgi:pimeloyl-ACP methyl ester carboxylesterase
MDLYYKVHGEGTPIVLLHSGGEDLRDWHAIAPQLSRTNKVVTFDGRGVGRSPAVLKPINYIEDFRAFLDFLGIDTAVLVGHSMGGQVATDFALTYPARVSRLVLISPGLTGFQFSPEYEQHAMQVMAAAPDVKKMVNISLDFPSYRVTMASSQRDLLYEMQKLHMQRILEWKTYQIDWPQPPAVERLDQLRAKTLFILGTEDIPDLFRVAETCKQIPDIRFAYIEGADHMPTLTHPNEVFRLITQFLHE